MNTSIESTNKEPEVGNSMLPLSGDPSRLNKFKYIGLFFLILLVVFAQYLFFHKEDKTISLSKKTADESYTMTSPLSKDQGEEALKADALEKQHELQRKIAQAKAKDFMERLEIAQNVSVDSMGNAQSFIGSSNTSPESNVQPNIVETAPQDPNTAFFLRASNSKTEREYATHFGPLPNVIGQGKFIFGTLAVAINSDLPGQIEAVVNQDIYGEQGEKILIPRGSHLIGEYRSGLANNQNRLFTVWTRIKEPNEIDIRLGSEGTDSLGRAGLTGSVDYHFLDRFGSAILISMISAGAANVGVSTSDQYNSASAYRQSVSQALADEAKNTLGQNINIPPTVYIPQGQRIVVFVNKDLDFSRVYP